MVGRYRLSGMRDGLLKGSRRLPWYQRGYKRNRRQPLSRYARKAMLRTSGSIISLKRKDFETRVEETSLFRRVRISCMSFVLSACLPAQDATNPRAELYVFTDSRWHYLGSGLCACQIVEVGLTNPRTAPSACC